MDNSSFQAIHGKLNFSKHKRRILAHLALDLMLVGLAVAAPWLAGLALAAIMFRSFSMMHEAVHGSLSNSKAINLFLGRYFGVFCGLPFDSWRKIHLDHHLWTGNLDKDPTMSIMRAHRDGQVAVTRVQEFCWHWWLPYLALRQQTVFWKRSFAAAPSRVNMAVQGICTLAFFGLTISLFGLFASASAFFGYCMLIEIVNFPHHMDLKQGGGGLRLPPAKQHLYTRTCLYTKWFERVVLLNFNYHIEHHLFPTLPWYRLPLAHELVRESLGQSYNFSENNEWFRASRRATLHEMLDRCAEPLQHEAPGGAQTKDKIA